MASIFNFFFRTPASTQKRYFGDAHYSITENDARRTTKYIRTCVQGFSDVPVKFVHDVHMYVWQDSPADLVPTSSPPKGYGLGLRDGPGVGLVWAGVQGRN